MRNGPMAKTTKSFRYLRRATQPVRAAAIRPRVARLSRPNPSKKLERYTMRATTADSTASKEWLALRFGLLAHRGEDSDHA